MYYGEPALELKRYVIVVKDESRKKRFADCKKCAGFKSSLAQEEDPKKKVLIREEKQEHFVREVQVEKQLYYGRRSEAKETMRNQHGGALPIIMDGEDKSSHQYPHLPRVPEELQQVERLTLKVRSHACCDYTCCSCVAHNPT